MSVHGLVSPPGFQLHLTMDHCRVSLARHAQRLEGSGRLLEVVREGSLEIWKLSA